MKKDGAVLFILVALVLLGLGTPAVISAAVPDDTRQGSPIVSGPELNMTGADMANRSIPSRYEIPPTPIDIKVEISDSSLPGPKGEMAAGPRTIGFSAEPPLLAVLIVAIITASAGVWYLVKRKPEEPVDENEEGGE